ncbi:AAA 5 domain containing protein [Asbolus verrucosus]|uniref:AAA 5 domain containing protein n=1 Tax=Asbolus verrucosus TaxID=1661398 RepID=A0A482VCB0_ASBVE|nr:AAA 5 domain containing protein [Asbolus verrucosus]
MKLETWLLIFLAFILLNATIWFLSMLQINESFYKSFRNCCLNNFAILIGTSVNLLPQSESVRFFTLAWIMFCLILNIIYQTQFITLMGQGIEEEQIETIEQLFNSDLQIQMKSSSFLFFDGSPLLQKILEKDFHQILTNVNPVIGNNVRAYISSDTVSVGEVTKVISKAKRPEYVPRNYYREDVGQSTLHHLRWMMQKDLLGQDIFLLGPPGSLKRNLAMQYLELTNREHEYVALSRDTTESDLKQRREIVKGTAKYFDQSAVRAAIEGRILILEGIEKAERNVLPVLNNLLENREMHLEDGRLLIPASRYDKLLEEYGKEELDKWQLIRVDENFRVIALGLPVPK